MLWAERYLKTAEMLIDDRDYVSSGSRSYYATLFAAHTLLRHVGSEPQTHSGIRNQFGLYFVEDAPLAEQFAGMRNGAEEMRTPVDYAEEFVLTEEDARATLQDAKAFAERMGMLLHDDL